MAMFKEKIVYILFFGIALFLLFPKAIDNIKIVATENFLLALVVVIVVILFIQNGTKKKA